MHLLFLVLLFASFQSNSVPSANGSVTVHFYRANQFVAKLRSPAVYCDESALAKMQNGRYFSAKLLPGTHYIRSEDKGVGIQLVAEEGGEYFVRIEMAVGTFKGTQQIVQVSPEQAQKEMRSLKPVDANKIIDRERVSAD